MGRYSPNPSYGHKCQYIGYGCYRLYWTTDRYYSDSRLRFPRQFSRDTDEVGARRFCNKWGIEFKKGGK